MNRKRWLALALAVCLLLGGCGQTESDETALEIWMIDVGNADCFLLRQGDRAMLIDAGLPGEADRIVSFIATQGIDTLDYVLLTHPHADHVGSMERVLSAFAVGSYLYADVPPELVNETPLHSRVKAVIDERSIATCEVSDGALFSLGAATVEIYPLLGEYDDLNEYSLICRVSFGEKRILFTGDAGVTSQERLIQCGYDLSADVYKVSHHGSNSGISETVLEAVGATYALIPCGADNSHYHPTKRTITRLNAAEMHVHRSDLCGDVYVTVEKSIRVRCQTETHDF